MQRLISLKSFIMVYLCLCPLLTFAAPHKNLDPYWLAHDSLSKKVITYPVWKQFLTQYLIVGKYQTLVNYGQVSKAEKAKLTNAIKRLEQIKISTYNRNQQLAYWINLYNMETVYLILQHYPIKSILKIGGSFFSRGPWNKNLLEVNDKALSLNDVEHRIIRPVWNDPRIHAAVNCASIGCPNLRPQPFEGKTIDVQLNQAFKAFVTNPYKGFKIKGRHIYLSKIFDWYGEDFGKTQTEKLKFIKDFLSQRQQKQLANIKKPKVRYFRYDWNLNVVR